MISPEDIAVELGRPTPSTTDAAYAQWQRWISDALFLIRNRLGDTALLDQEALDYVVRQAVAAHVRRPDDATQVTTSVDDANISRRYDSGRGRVEILPEWWALLSPGTGDGGPVGSFQLYGEPDTVDPVTVTP